MIEGMDVLAELQKLDQEEVPIDPFKGNTCISIYVCMNKTYREL